MHFIKIIIISILPLVLASCGTQDMTITTSPDGVDVKVIGQDGGVRNVGKTPLNLNTNKFFQGEDMIKVYLSKPSHQTKILYLNKPSLYSNMKVSAQLDEKNQARDILSQEKIEYISKQIAEAQRHSFSKNFSRAKNILEELIEQYPGISVSYDLIANIYYLNNDLSKALFFYEKANEIAPGNNKRSLLIQKLKARLWKSLSVFLSFLQVSLFH